MTTQPFQRRICFTAAAVALAAAPQAHGQDVAQPADKYAAFEPQPDGRELDISYEAVDKLLGRLVLPTGRSLRQSAPPALPVSGTRMVHGHTSPWRLEGNKVLFSTVDDTLKQTIIDYTASLVRFGNRVPLVHLPRDDQLAYWLNIHNLLVIAEIAKNYPVTRPTTITIGPQDQPFHDAPIVVMNGIALSLKDIRVNIVYRNWPKPRVMYGFFHGDLASPSMRNKAWTAGNVSENLDKNALEFINSLRGIRGNQTTMRVSPLYKEARGTLFPKWPEDFRTHIRKYAEEDVNAIVDRTKHVVFGRRAARTADLVGGYPYIPASALATVPDGTMGWKPGQSPLFGLMLKELQEKSERLVRQKNRGRVTITDLPDAKKDQEKETDNKEDATER